MDKNRALKLSQLQERLGYQFLNQQTLDMALTHTSYVKGEGNKVPHNERLEFLGDAVLELMVSEILYAHEPKLDEGAMTRIRANVVCEGSLCEVAKELSLGECLLLSRGEENSGGREKASILSDAMEAVIGAVFVDGGVETAREFIRRILGKHIKQGIASGKKGKGKDAKTLLQEYVQQKKLGTLTYEIRHESGPDHQKHFVLDAVLDGELIGTGSGGSKLEAGQEAAKHALFVLRKKQK